MKYIKPKLNLEFKEGVVYPKHIVTENNLLDQLLSMITNDCKCPSEEICDIEDILETHIDLGGMVQMHEPYVEVTIGDTKISCFIRQLEFLMPAFRQVKELPCGDRVVWISAAWTTFVFTETTAKLLEDSFNTKAIEMKDEIDKCWAKMDSTRIVKDKDGVVALSLSREQRHEFITEKERRELIDREIDKLGH